MADHSKPTLTSAYSDFVTELDARLDDLAFALNPEKTTVTNPPVDAIRFNTATNRREKWTGTAWAELVPKTSDAYDERVALADDVVSGSSTAKGVGQIGRAAVAVSTDADDYTEAGVWYFTFAQASQNFPTFSGGFLYVHTRESGVAIRQTWYRNGSPPSIYTRVSSDSGATWCAWKHVTADADWNAASGADGFIANKPTLGTAAALAAQTSATDTTSGRLMSVGAFGLGGFTPVVSASGALGSLGHTGFVTVDYLNRLAVGGPPGVVSGVVLTAHRSAGYASQMWMDMGGTKPQTFVRENNNGTWGSWRLIYDSASLLGTVSQSSGVPTGAVIERGSNANGEYVRFADGTQICHFQVTETDGSTTAAGSVYRATTPYAWTFPAAFATSTNVAISASMQTVTSGWVNARTVSNTSATIEKWTPVADSTARTMRVTAIGRWF